MTALATEPRAMSKERNESVRLESDVLRKARIVAAIRNVSLTAYLSGVLAPHVAKDYAAALADEVKGTDKPKR